jgi:very-short-patch-repair endonuclease
MTGEQSAARRRRRRTAIERVAAGQGGVVGRRQLYHLGVTRWEVEAELRAKRWTRIGPQCVLVGQGTEQSELWRALFEVGPSAVLDGITALQVAGLRTIDTPLIQVAVPKSVTPHRCRGVRVYETRRYRSEDVIRDGIPRMRPPTAAVHAALWARTNSEAALCVVAPVQQRLLSVDELAEAVDLIQRHARKKLLRGLVGDVGSGIEAMGEREFARLCRRRGWPKPTRQQVRRLPSGRVYFDVAWEQFHVVVEIDGVQHLDAAVAAKDALKQNAATLDGARVLRIPNWALRADPEPFLDQVEAALIAGGWTR